MSRWWQVLERVKTTQIMFVGRKLSHNPGQHAGPQEIHQRNWSKCTCSHRASSSNLHDQRSFSPALTNLNFQSSKMPIPTRRKTTKTMAPRRWSTPSNICCTHPWNIPRWPQPRLRHTHTLRPETPPFKRKRETSQTSASSATTTFYCSVRV